MPSVTTRIATMDDYEAICRLLAQADRHHAEILPDVFQTFTGPIRPRALVAEFIEAEDADYLLAEIEGEPVGLLNLRKQARPSYPMFRSHEFAMIHNMVVDEAHRRRGIGTALLEEAKRWTRDRGLTAVQLGVWAGNAPAVSFYRKHGFRVLTQRMELRLDPASS